MSGAKLLVVNADDLGRTPGVDAGIFEAHARGIVTSATLMVGFPAAVAAAARLGEFPQLGVGLHVTLTGARPTLPPERVTSLVDAEGRFAAKPEGLGALELSQVLAEVHHQLARFRELVGRPPTHLDSHHHSHRHPVVLEALVLVAHEHRLPVRCSSPAVRERLVAAGVPTTDSFVERFFGEQATRTVLGEILAGLLPGSTEIMCHPAHVDAELAASSSYAVPRERELAVLTDPAIRLEVERLGIRLVGFPEACAS